MWVFVLWPTCCMQFSCMLPVHNLPICLSKRAKALSTCPPYSLCSPPSLSLSSSSSSPSPFLQVEVKPYVLDDQICDECHGINCGGQYAPYFCGNIHCLRYYCEHCWAAVHSAPGTQNHRCFIKENGDRPRAINLFPSQPRLMPKASLLAAATSCRH